MQGLISKSYQVGTAFEWVWSHASAQTQPIQPWPQLGLWEKWLWWFWFWFWLWLLLLLLLLWFGEHVWPGDLRPGKRPKCHKINGTPPPQLQNMILNQPLVAHLLMYRSGARLVMVYEKTTLKVHLNESNVKNLIPPTSYWNILEWWIADPHCFSREFFGISYSQRYLTQSSAGSEVSWSV